MDPVDLDDEEQGRLLARSNSWSHSQRPAFLEKKHSVGHAARPNGLSCIYEADDSNGPANQDADFAIDTLRNRSKSMSHGTSTGAGHGGTTGTTAQVKKRRHSYTELIASAILSSPEKRKTLAEIYDWFVMNVPSFKDQRYMHSSLGWKNAVRHNLSVQTCFKRVKRHGMEKPSWWTVDMTEVSKRRLVLRPTVNPNNGDGDGDVDGPFLPPRRNTYSGPNPSQQSTTTNNETSGAHKMAYRVASSSDLHTANLQYMNSNKRTHYTPIRPAVPSQASDMPMFTLGNTRYNSGSGELTFGDASCFNNNEIKMEDGVFLRPCAVDTSPVTPTNLHSPTLFSSVTLVCKESPTSSHPYRQAQLEVSFQANESGQHINSSVSPSGYCWNSPTSSSCSQASLSPSDQSGMSMNHFNTWPNIADVANGAPNQTLRVKTIWGNVEDINFNGLLPMRTVVKCDGGTQTEGSRDHVDVQKDFANKNFERSQWNQAQSRYQHANNLYDHESTLVADLPEDLAGLQIEGDIQCDIDAVLGASLEPSVSRPMWGSWSWNNSPFDQSPYADRIEDSSFNTARMDMSEI